MPLFDIGTDISARAERITAQDLDLALDIAIARARARNAGPDALPWAVPVCVGGKRTALLPASTQQEQHA